MNSKKYDFCYKGFIYHSKMKITNDSDIVFEHDIRKKSNPSNVVFVYWGLQRRPLEEDEFKSYVDQMLKITESGY